MENGSSNKVEQFVKYNLFLDFIDNLDTSLNFPLQFNVRVEFHGSLCGGNDHVPVMDTVGAIDLDVSLHFPVDEILDYRYFASHPMLIYFESLNGIEKNSQKPKETGSGNNQTWICIVDLLPLVYDGTADGGSRDTVSGQYPLKAFGELNRDLLSHAVLNATVSRSETGAFSPTVTPKNVLSVVMHGLYNPPSIGRRRSPHAATRCTATLQEMSRALDADFHGSVFANGTYTNVTRDVNDLRWYSLDNMPATVSATGQRFEEHDCGGGGGCVVVNSAKIPDPKHALSKGPRFEWNLWQRSLLDEMSAHTFQDFVFKNRYVIVTFSIAENPNVTMQESNYASSTNDKVVYAARLDLSMLLQPNCTSVRCFSTVHAFNVNTAELSSVNFDHVELTKTNVRESTSSWPETSKCESVQSTAEWTMPFVVVEISVSNSFYDQYLKHLTTRLLKLDVIFQKPTTTLCAQRAMSNKYLENLKSTIKTLMETSERIYDEDGVEDCVNGLKVSGAYESMQSSMCDQIKLYITDNYEGPLIGETVQSFVNRIFVDLVDKMKKTVESFEFSSSCGGGDAENVEFNCEVIYAREADELKQTESAGTFYTDLISTAGTRCNPNYWLLYASFCSRRLDFDTALEYVKEVLLVDSGNRIGLFLYAAIQLTVHEDNNNGEIVLKSLVMSHGGFSEVYALLSVHYSTLSMHEASYAMLQRAQISVEEDEFAKDHPIQESLLSWTSIGHGNDPLIKCAILLLELELVKLATHCLDLVKNQHELYHYYMAVCEYKNGNYSASLEHLNCEQMTSKYEKVVDALKCLNRMDSDDGLDVLDKDDVSRVIYAVDPCEEHRLVYLKAALLCYAKKSYARGVEICRIARGVLRTPVTCTLLAKCLIEIGELETAESALNEANIMDVKNEEVWAYLTVVNIKLGNADEAKVCYTQALEYGLKPEMKKEIDTLFKTEIDILI